MIDLERLSGSDVAWPDYGDAIGLALESDFSSLTADDSCGCELGAALVANLERLYNGVNNTSNNTKLGGVEGFLASIVDNVLINRLLTRLVSQAPEATEEVQVIVSMILIFLGDRTFIVIVGVLNTAVLPAYIAEFVRTRAGKATPHFDIMNDSEIIVAAFEGGRSTEKSLKHGASEIVGEQRVSESIKLSLQYNDTELRKPILKLHFSASSYADVPTEELLSFRDRVTSVEQIPLVERHNT
jgi:hypothetical protein